MYYSKAAILTHFSWIYSGMTVLLSHSSMGWGFVGHEAIGNIAAHHLSAKALERVNQVLAFSPAETLATASTWPDRIRSDHQWDFAKPYHYVTTQKDSGYFEKSKANPEGDVVRAIFTYQELLRRSKKVGNANVSDEKTLNIQLNTQLNALRFLSHFIGDIHQPLHTNLDDGTKGGNTVVVKFLDTQKQGKGAWNLHSVWDSAMVEHDFKTNCSAHKNYADCLIADTKLIEAATSTPQLGPVDWAYESSTILAALMSDVKDGNVDQAYIDQYLPIVRMKIAVAGIRLARVLEQCLVTRVPDPVLRSVTKKFKKAHRTDLMLIHTSN